MKLCIHIEYNTDTMQFHEDAEPIVRECAAALVSGDWSGHQPKALYDRNGNRVGTMEMIGRDKPQPASILDQWEPAPEWAKAAKRVDAQSVNNTTRTGPDGCLPALS